MKVLKDIVYFEIIFLPSNVKYGKKKKSHIISVYTESKNTTFQRYTQDHHKFYSTLHKVCYLRDLIRVLHKLTKNDKLTQYTESESESVDFYICGCLYPQMQAFYLDGIYS